MDVNWRYYMGWRVIGQRCWSPSACMCNTFSVEEEQNGVPVFRNLHFPIFFKHYPLFSVNSFFFFFGYHSAIGAGMLPSGKGSRDLGWGERALRWGNVVCAGFEPFITKVKGHSQVWIVICVEFSFSLDFL